MACIGCAGWALPPDEDPRLAGPGSHLERYARIFPATEINSSFHRPHRASTYAKWAEATPEGFRFSVKIPKAITHGAGLANAKALLDEFLDPLAALGRKLECLLVQLPPKLEFDAAVAGRFLRMLRRRHGRAIALEPRNATWFAPRAGELLRELRIARVAADPPRTSTGGEPRRLARLRLLSAARLAADVLLELRRGAARRARARARGAAPGVVHLRQHGGARGGLECLVPSAENQGNRMKGKNP